MTPQKNYHVQYHIAMSKLAIICEFAVPSRWSHSLTTGAVGRMMATRYNPHSLNNCQDVKSVGDELTRWKKNLPQEMLLQGIDGAGGAGFWAAMLHANYQ